MRISRIMFNHLAAVVLSCSAFSAHAISGFVGGDIGFVSWPNFISDINSFMIAKPTVWSVSSKQDVISTAYGIRGGAWFNNVVGAEGGYDNLGTINASTTATVCSFGCVTSTGDYSYSATAIHAAALIGNPRIFARIGLHSNSTTLSGNYVTGGGTYSRSTSGTGLLLGVGSGIPVGKHVDLQISFNIFNGVKFVDWTNFNNTLSKNLYRLTFGAAYKF